MSTLTSSLIVKLVDQVTGPAKGVANTLRGLNNTAGTGRASLADNIVAAQTRVGDAIAANNRALDGARGRLVDAVAGYYLLDRTIGSTVRVAGDFQQSMNQVAAVSRASEDQLASMTAQAKELGRTTQFTASEVADGMNFLAMAGFNAEQVFASMPGTLDLAAAGQLELGRAADIVSNILTGYNLDVEELGRATDVLTGTFTRSNTDLLQLGEAFKYAGPVAAAAGMEFEEAAAMLGAMGNAGIQGSMAGTSLRGAIVRLLGPTGDARSLMENLEISMEDVAGESGDLDGALNEAAEAMSQIGLRVRDAEGNMLPMVDIMRQLEQHAHDTELMIKIFGVRAGPAMQAALGQGADAVEGLADELRTLEGETRRVADVQMAGFNGQMRAFRSAVEGVQIAIGTALLPALTQFFNKVTELLGPITSLLEAHPKLTAAIVGTAGAFVGLRIATAALTFAGLLGKGGALSLLNIGLHTVGSTAIWVSRSAGGMIAYERALAGMAGTKLTGLQTVTSALKGMALAVPGIAPLTGALTAVGGALATISAPVWGGIALAVAAVAGAGALLYKYWDRVTSVIGGVARRIGEELAPALDFLGPVLEPIGAVVRGIGDAFGFAGEKIGDFIGWLGSFFEREVLSEEQKAAWGEAGYDVADSMIDGVKSVIFGFLDWISNLPQMVIEAIGQIDLRGIIRLPSVDDIVGGIGGAVQSGVNNLFGGGANDNAPTGHRAGGGPVWAGNDYLVGENEPEIISPRSSSEITPLSAIEQKIDRMGSALAARAANGRGQPVTITIGEIVVQAASDPVETARRVRDVLRDELDAALRGAHADTAIR